MSDSFSKRHGYRSERKSISVREDAPRDLREAIIPIAEESGIPMNTIRELVCRALRKTPDTQNNWSHGNVESEVSGLLNYCDWFKIYDVIEVIARHSERFAEVTNEFFEENGIGWQVNHGIVETRGDEAFESAIKRAAGAFGATSNGTAASELHEALRDLSRRPQPDVTGAIQHSMAALECLARQVCGAPNPSLGQLLQRHPDKLQIPRPLDEAVEKAWGYASETGRHLREGREPTRREAELIVALCASLCAYLTPES